MYGNGNIVDLCSVCVVGHQRPAWWHVLKSRMVLIALRAYLSNTIMMGKYDLLAIHALSLCQ